MYQSMGISPFDVDQWITAGSGVSPGPNQPPLAFHAARGDFDPVALDARLKECSACPAASVEDRHGWRIYPWGGDNEVDQSRGFKPPMFDQFGRGGRLAVSEGVVMRALSTPDIQPMVDAADGTGSLAYNDDFRLAAEGLQRLEAWTARLTERDPAASVPDQEFLDLLASEELLRPYAVLAHGDGYEGNKRYVAVALVHRTPEDAAESARRLPGRVGPAQRAFAYMDEQARLQQGPNGPAPGPVAACDKAISDLDVEVDGHVLLATLRFHEFDPQCRGGFFFFGMLAHE
jgi:hypothetical protein